MRNVPRVRIWDDFNSACVLAPAHSGCLKMWLMAANVLAWILVVLAITRVSLKKVPQA